MTEAVIIALLLTAVVWVSRMCRRAVCRLRGVEHDPSGEGPLPIVRAWCFVRDYYLKLWTWWTNRRRAGAKIQAEPIETE